MKKLEELTREILQGSKWQVTPKQSEVICNKAKQFGFNYWSGEMDLKKDATIIFKNDLYFQYQKAMPDYYTERKFSDYFEVSELQRIHDAIEDMRGTQ